VPVPAVQCADPGDDPFVCIASVTLDEDDNLIAPFTTINFDAEIGSAPAQHIHFYFPVGSMVEDQTNAGATGPDPGSWVIWDEPAVFGPGGPSGSYSLADAQAVGASELCAIVVSADHEAFPDTGNCVPINLSRSGGSAASATTTTPGPTTTIRPTTTIPPTTTTSEPADVECADPGTDRFVCIRSVSVDADGGLVAPFDATNFEPFIGGAPNHHIHFYFPVGVIAENQLNAGTSGPSPGGWRIWDTPSTFGPGGNVAAYTVDEAAAVEATELCALVADAQHQVIADSGNCVEIPS